jgi:hypothetical protein
MSPTQGVVRVKSTSTETRANPHRLVPSLLVDLRCQLFLFFAVSCISSFCPTRPYGDSHRRVVQHELLIGWGSSSSLIAWACQISIYCGTIPLQQTPRALAREMLQAVRLQQENLAVGSTCDHAARSAALITVRMQCTSRLSDSLTRLNDRKKREVAALWLVELFIANVTSRPLLPTTSSLSGTAVDSK